MKKILLAIGFTTGLLFLSSPVRAQVPYGYDPYGAYVEVQPDYPQAYDPYYQLHVMHYQLYLQPYGYYYPAYFGAPQAVAPAAPVLAAPGVAARGVVSRAAAPLRSAIPVVKRR